MSNDSWNEEEGVLSLVEFKPQMPVTLSVGISVAKDPVKREELKRIFLSVLRSTASVQDAAKICQIPLSLGYVWRTEDPEFAYKWDQIVKSEMIPHLESEAVRRAMNGSDLLLMFMLKALDRDKYDDKVAEKRVAQPTITIQMLDVDKALLGKAESHGVNGSSVVPAVKYLDGVILEGEKADGEAKSITDLRKDPHEIGSSNEPTPRTEGTSKE